MIAIPVLFHWSPSDRRQSIQQQGLLINSPNKISTEPVPYICAGTDPKSAWAHSVGTLIMAGKSPPEQGDPWDLWQINVSHGMPIHVQPEYGPFVKEVRVTADIEPSRLWLCGTRTDRSTL